MVSDGSGRLYNKDAVLEFLLPATDGARKSDAEEVLAGRVKSLKDVVEVKFEVDDEGSSESSAAGRREERWLCPITRKQLGPKIKSVYLVPCGHAFSDMAIREVCGETCAQVCLLCPSPGANSC